MTKPTLPPGTRDFGPDVVRKRNYIFSTIRNVFERYGFQPLETPAMENIETLMGKYGDEGDKLIFKILNNGLANPEKEELTRKEFEKVLQGKNSKGITERALKYDLTIPFARYVAMNHAQLIFPFKRYQIQPVWRADRPQKGRYREFYQCDADVVGSDSLLNEIELANIYNDAFSQLGIKNYELRINHRKILTALAELCGGAEKMNDIAIAIDKLDKIGLEKVKEELVRKHFSAAQLSVIENYLSIYGTNKEKLSGIKSLLLNNVTGEKGIKELEHLITNCRLVAQNSSLILDFTLARGLNYYTGIIFEATAKDVSIGSIGGGGRYDDLTGLFGVPNIPGVGISFGVDRIYDVMEELSLFPASLQVSTQVLFFNLGDAESNVSFDLMQQLRQKNIRCELYHEKTKFDKQFKYAEKKNIPYVVILGGEEIKNKSCKLKNLAEGKQQDISWNDLLNYSFT
ncbi:MAG: histidine--tRNA ligase [Bacteroidetes bacterium]|nr:histidine--tRNA ligase [Bacteroidota bacterium]MBS1931260.1 histidine--tRNA ligase [Bacteroidota bacterium]